MLAALAWSCRRLHLVVRHRNSVLVNLIVYAVAGSKPLPFKRAIAQSIGFGPTPTSEQVEAIFSTTTIPHDRGQRNHTVLRRERIQHRRLHRPECHGMSSQRIHGYKPPSYRCHSLNALNRCDCQCHQSQHSHSCDRRPGRLSARPSFSPYCVRKIQQHRIHWRSLHQRWSHFCWRYTRAIQYRGRYQKATLCSLAKSGKWLIDSFGGAT